MPFVIMCGGCKRKLRISDTLLGKIVKCPHCARKARMPAQLRSAGKPAKQLQSAARTAMKSASAATAAVAKRSAAKARPTKPEPEVNEAPVKKKAVPAAEAAPTEPAPDVNGAPAKKKPSAGAAPTPATNKKKPGRASAVEKSAPAPAPKAAAPASSKKPAPEPEPEIEPDISELLDMEITTRPDQADAFEPEPPPVKPRPSAPAPPAPAAPRKPARPKRDDDDEEGRGYGKIVIFGGAFIAICLVGFVIAFCFFGDISTGFVNGTVTLDGTPVEGAHVKLIDEKETDPEAEGHPGITGKDGSFRIIGPHIGGGVPLGKYKVVVTKKVLPDGSLPKGEGDHDPELLKNALPPDYGDATKTSLNTVVTSGRNPLELKLTAPK